MKAKMQAVVPEGENFGHIKAARETTKDFGDRDSNGKPVLKPVVEIVISPEYREPGRETLDLGAIWAASLNGLSGLSALLTRLGVVVKDGDDFQPATLVGKRVRFVTERNKAGFMAVVKESVEAAPLKK